MLNSVPTWRKALAGFFLLSCLAWGLFAFWFVPWLIEEAYYERSFAVFNQILAGRAEHPVTMYLGDWQPYAISGQGVLVFLSIVFVLDAWLAGRHPAKYSVTDDETVVPTSRGERLKAYALLTVIAVPSIYCIARGQDNWWPYSSYPMYSGIFTAETQRIELIAEGPDNKSISLTRDAALLPMGRTGAQFFVRHVLGQPDGREKMNHCMQSWAKIYQSLSARDSTAYPPYQKLKLVQNRWELNVGVENYSRPEVKVLCEVPLFPTPTGE